MDGIPVKVDRDKALAAYNSADDKGKQLLRDLLSESDLVLPSGKITDRVKTFGDACAELQLDSTKEATRISEMSPDTQAYEKLKIIVEALNEGWKPNYADKKEYKWYPWFKYDKGLCGFGLSFNGHDYDFVITVTGARLVFKSRELADYAGRIFEKLYVQYLAWPDNDIK